VLIVAGGAAWLALVGLGPVAVDVPPPHADVPGEPSSTAPGDPSVVDRLPTPVPPPSVDPPDALPPSPAGLPPPGIPVVQVDDAPDPEVAERIRAATSDALARRLEMVERMFDAAPTAVVDEADRGRVSAVLDEALDQMRALEDQVASGDLTYREAVERMDTIRDAAGARVEVMVTEEEATPVKLRMGIRPPPDPADVQAWEGVPAQDGGDWR
jgi:hypothetical protein